MSGILIRQIDDTQSINFDEIEAFAKRLFENRISIEKIDDYSPNDETIQAIKECDTGKGSTRYDSYDDFLKELNTFSVNYHWMKDNGITHYLVTTLDIMNAKLCPTCFWYTK